MNVTIGTDHSQRSEVIRLVYMTNQRLFNLEEGSEEPVISVTFHDHPDSHTQGADVKLFVEQQPGVSIKQESLRTMIIDKCKARLYLPIIASS